MATSEHKSKWNGKSLDNGSTRSDDLFAITLEYPHKKTSKEILETTKADVDLLWKNTNLRSKNRLYFGDNLPLLAKLLDDSDVCGKVRLIYIDPPFSTSGVFKSRSRKDAYQDLLEGYEYIEFMRQRLILMHQLLSDDGSIYVHIDDNMLFHIKVIMDEVFGRSNYRNLISRRKSNPKNYTRHTYGNVTDYILFYTKTGEYVWNRPYQAWTDEQAIKEYSYIEEGTGRRYKKVPIHAPGERKGDTGQPWKGKNPPPGKHWQYTREKLDDMDTRGEIYWSPNGNPRRKIYLDDSLGIPLQDIWVDVRDAHNQNIKITGYPTEKPPRLLERIIAASSDEGDMILDCFSGSGTTLAVASQLNRQWIGMDSSSLAIQTTLDRFRKGLSPMGDFVTDKPRQLPLLDFDTILDFSLYCDTSQSLSQISEAVTAWVNSISNT